MLRQALTLIRQTAEAAAASKLTSPEGNANAITQPQPAQQGAYLHMQPLTAPGCPDTLPIQFPGNGTRTDNTRGKALQHDRLHILGAGRSLRLRGSCTVDPGLR